MSKFHVGPNGPKPCKVSTESRRTCPYDPDGVGDNHFDTPEEAQGAYEARMESTHGLVPAAAGSSSTVDSSLSASKTQDVDPNDYPDSMIEGGLNMLSKSDQNLLKKLRDGKSVKPRAIDEFLYANESNLTRPNDSYTDFSNARKLYDFAASRTVDRGALSTLPTVSSFDPATETMFSVKDARLNPYVTGKAIKRQADEGDRARRSAEEYRELARDYDGETDLDYKFKAQDARADAQRRERDAQRADARLSAMLKEAQYLEANDPKYSDKMDPALRRKVQNYKVGSNYTDQKLGGLRPVKS